ncbi:unnamed protein product [Eruca vesicaria subsp. sativa]|uniref:GDSL esterase/lipase n=1 Tax=Eruca vesicaria subsp. sativa TaxID=29727 RepID=A0ABC8K5A3_ERUVS|nr:unnamed protein product [Eruca vesicaria subsp. sativa]
MGGRTFLVPGEFPMGCSVTYLTLYQTSNQEEYDPSGCLKWLNKFAKYHSDQLQAELNMLRELYPHLNTYTQTTTTLCYAFFKNRGRFIEKPLHACCGSGGPYNFTSGRQCGFKGVESCSDPSKYVCWDGVHMIEAAYRLMAVRN